MNIHPVSPRLPIIRHQIYWLIFNKFITNLETKIFSLLSTNLFVDHQFFLIVFVFTSALTWLLLANTLLECHPLIHLKLMRSLIYYTHLSYYSFQNWHSSSFTSLPVIHTRVAIWPLKRPKSLNWLFCNSSLKKLIWLYNLFFGLFWS